MKELSKYIKDSKFANFALTILLAATLSPKLFAQDRIGNGGDGGEVELLTQKIQLEATAGKIFQFFSENSELEEVFPEFSREDILALQGKVKFEVSNDVLTDREGAVRTCLNYSAAKRIQCNYTRLAGLSPTVYFVLNLHELLGILGVEIASIENDYLIESYPISSRLARYVSRVQNHDLVFTPGIVHDWSNDEDARPENNLQAPSCVIKNLIVFLRSSSFESNTLRLIG